MLEAPKERWHLLVDLMLGPDDFMISLGTFLVSTMAQLAPLAR